VAYQTGLLDLKLHTGNTSAACDSFQVANQEERVVFRVEKHLKNVKV
jgi:hypothetical protein